MRINWNVSTVISVVALVLSLGQLLFTTPLLLDMYIKPKLVVYGTVPVNNHLYGFDIINEGNKLAENVELAIIAGEHDIVRVMPNLGANISHDNSVWVRNFRIVIPYLGPGESVAVIVDVASDSPKFVQGSSTENPDKVIKTGNLPAVVYFRTKEGKGEIKAIKFDAEIL